MNKRETSAQQRRRTTSEQFSTSIIVTRREKKCIVLFLPLGTEYCRTLHIMDSRGISVMVEKHCAAAAECEEHNVGCLPMDGQQVNQL